MNDTYDESGKRVDIDAQSRCVLSRSYQARFVAPIRKEQAQLTIADIRFCTFGQMPNQLVVPGPPPSTRKDLFRRQGLTLAARHDLLHFR